MSRGGYRQINKALNICAFDDYLSSQHTKLPVLRDVEQISPRVIRILGQNPGKFTLQGTNTYIVGTGSRRLIIDTGQGFVEWAELVRDKLDEVSAALSTVLLTHWHGDHTGGVPDLLREYPELEAGIFKHTPDRTQKAIVDGQVFRVEGATVRAHHSPGHSHDHTCFILEEENAMFTGDNVLGHGTAAVENLGVWMSSLRAMQAQNCVKGYPAHGDVIHCLPTKIKDELAQKTRREERVLHALDEVRRGGGTGTATTTQLVTTMHGDAIDGEVRGLAIEPFTEEILKKLTEDGKVAFKLQRGERKWFRLRT